MVPVQFMHHTRRGDFTHLQRWSIITRYGDCHVLPGIFPVTRGSPSTSIPRADMAIEWPNSFHSFSHVIERIRDQNFVKFDLVGLGLSSTLNSTTIALQHFSLQENNQNPNVPWEGSCTYAPKLWEDLGRVEMRRLAKWCDLGSKVSIYVIKRSKRGVLDEWEGWKGWEGLWFRGWLPLSKC